MLAPFAGGGDEHRRMLVERHQRRRFEARLWRSESLVLRKTVFHVRQVDHRFAKGDCTGNFSRLGPLLVVSVREIGEEAAAFTAQIAQLGSDIVIVGHPALEQLLPSFLALCFVRFEFLFVLGLGF